MTPRTARRVAAVPALLAGAALSMLSCDGDAGRSPVSPEEVTPAAASATGPSIAGALLGRLPSRDTVTSSVPAFEIKQKGGGIAGRFEITNPSSAAIALDGVSSGTGHALLAWNLGLGRGAVVIQSNANATVPAFDVSASGRGSAAEISANSTTTQASALLVDTRGRGPVFTANHLGTAGSLAVFQVNGVNKIRLARNGRGFFNAGTQNSGADVAETFQVDGTVGEYEPGDVLVISERADRRVAIADEAYSTRVIGVHATKPGVLLTERDIDESIDDMVPVAVIGVVPTRVSAENGAIRRGDLLVTAGTPGHAMRGTDRERLVGAVLGKALAEFSGPGTGVIPVLVNVK